MNIKLILYLILQKIRISTKVRLEKRVKSTSSIDIDLFIFFLIKEVFSKLIIHDKGIYYKTRINNKKKPVIVSQTRLISLLCDCFDNPNFPIRTKNLIEKLTVYLITLKKGDNLYEFNSSNWAEQDEGVASVWAGIAFIKAHGVLKEPQYLDECISVYNAILNKLYTREKGLVHTLGEDFWCINTSSKFAYLSALILNYKNDEMIKEAMINSINICINHIDKDGHFPYTEVHRSTYLLLYHASVVFYLNKCKESRFLPKEIIEKILETEKNALRYLLSCLDNDYRFNEPEILELNNYIITMVTSLATVKGKIDKRKEEMILKNILRYYQNDNLFLVMNKSDYLFNGKRYEYHDVMLVEVLYWLVQYFGIK